MQLNVVMQVRTITPTYLQYAYMNHIYLKTYIYSLVQECTTANHTPNRMAQIQDLVSQTLADQCCIYCPGKSLKKVMQWWTHHDFKHNKFQYEPPRRPYNTDDWYGWYLYTSYYEEAWHISGHMPQHHN